MPRHQGSILCDAYLTTVFIKNSKQTVISRSLLTGPPSVRFLRAAHSFCLSPRLAALFPGPTLSHLFSRCHLRSARCRGPPSAALLRATPVRVGASPRCWLYWAPPGPRLTLRKPRLGPCLPGHVTLHVLSSRRAGTGTLSLGVGTGGRLRLHPLLALVPTASLLCPPSV